MSNNLMTSIVQVCGCDNQGTGYVNIIISNDENNHIIFKVDLESGISMGRKKLKLVPHVIAKSNSK